MFASVLLFSGSVVTIELLMRKLLAVVWMARRLCQVDISEVEAAAHVTTNLLTGSKVIIFLCIKTVFPFCSVCISSSQN